jgi:hypothetical protein
VAAAPAWPLASKQAACYVHDRFGGFVTFADHAFRGERHFNDGRISNRDQWLWLCWHDDSWLSGAVAAVAVKSGTVY